MNMQHTTQHLQALVEAYMDADRDAAQCDHPTRDRACLPAVAERSRVM